MKSFLAVVTLQISTCFAFFPSATRLGNTLSTVAQVRHSSIELNAQISDKNVFDSKLMPPMTEDELNELFQEFNITNFDINNDPEMEKWAPSKQFFEKFGFQNNTEKYKRKVMDVKTDFYSAYTKPILPQYKTFVSDFMTVSFIQSVDSRYKYDALHAFGICTQYYTIMKGYALSDEVNLIP
jgi:hypothetical protein